MKKIYTILGNKPFEDKLLEQLSSRYIPVGRFDVVNEEALLDFKANTADTLIVRENLADSPEAFYEFLKQAKLFNQNLKIIALLQPRNIGHDFIYKVASLGVFDIINNGTRLADVIELALRESTKEDVLMYLNDEQKERMNQWVEPTSAQNRVTSHLNEEELLIEIDGELQLDKEAQATNFKERYLSGITQVYTPLDEDKESKVQLPNLTPNDLVEPVLADESQDDLSRNAENNPFGFNLPGMSNRTVDLKETAGVIKEFNENIVEENMEFDLSESPNSDVRHIEEVAQNIEDFDAVESNAKVEPITVEPKKVIEDKPKPVYTNNEAFKQMTITFFLVSHRLQSSIAMQYATAKAKTKKVAYIETDSRNQVLESPFIKGGANYYWLAKGEKLEDLLESIKREDYDEVVLNTSNLMYLKVAKPQIVFCEIVQDREYAIEIRERLTDYPKARIIVSYFEPDLISQKSLNKVYNRSSIRWVNTRIEEYNSRLNGKLLQNQAINELLKEV